MCSAPPHVTRTTFKYIKWEYLWYRTALRHSRKKEGNIKNTKLGMVLLSISSKGVSPNIGMGLNYNLETVTSIQTTVPYVILFNELMDLPFLMRVS